MNVGCVGPSTVMAAVAEIGTRTSMVCKIWQCRNILQQSIILERRQCWIMGDVRDMTTSNEYVLESSMVWMRKKCRVHVRTTCGLREIVF